ncbi:MAG: hypothetical protein AAGB02_01510 [Pseudomonadota bacterium]
MRPASPNCHLALKIDGLRHARALFIASTEQAIMNAINLGEK